MMSENHTAITQVYELTVKDVLKQTNPKTSFVEKTGDMKQILTLIKKEGHVWVVDEKKACHVVGVITESDILTLFAPPYNPVQSFEKPTLHSFQYGFALIAEEIMSKQPITTTLDEKIVTIVTKMKQHKIKQLPVIDDQGVLIGEINLSQLISEYYTREGNITKTK
jgi:predicted transcriptional regulator